MSAQMSARLSAGLTVLSVAKIVVAPCFRTVAGCICRKNRCCTVFSDNYRGLSCSAAQNMTFVRDAQVGRPYGLGGCRIGPGGRIAGYAPYRGGSGQTGQTNQTTNIRTPRNRRIGTRRKYVRPWYAFVRCLGTKSTHLPACRQPRGAHPDNIHTTHPHTRLASPPRAPRLHTISPYQELATVEP